MITTIDQALTWYRTVGWRDNSFPEQTSSLPNDGKQILSPVGMPIDEFDPHLHNPRNESPLLHRHKFFVMMYMHRGACDTTIDEQPLTLHEGDILLLSPNVMHKNTMVDREDGVMFHCRIDSNLLCNHILPIVSESLLMSSFILDFIADKNSNHFLYFPRVGTQMDVRSVFESILLEYANQRPLSKSLIRCHLAALFTLLARERYTPVQRMQKPELLVQMIDYISTHYATVSLAAMAEKFHYHPNYLSSFIREKTGKSFSQLVLAYRLTRAHFLLFHSSFSTEEIAHQVGYHDVSSFYKAYKHAFGTPPRQSVPAQEQEDSTP